MNSTAFSNLADEYIALRGLKSPSDISIYLNEKKDVNLKVVFTNQLLNRQDQISYTIMDKIDSDLSITDAENPELGQRWFPLAIAVNYDKAFAAAKKSVQTIGR